MFFFNYKIRFVSTLFVFLLPYVALDEAAQAVEPSTLIPMKYNPKSVVLVGDPCQLPATVFSRIAKDLKYDQSLFQVRVIYCRWHCDDLYIALFCFVI